MTRRRLFAVLLVLYLARDYSDPSVPGVFFFAVEGFYLEGVVESRADAVPATPVSTPTPIGVDRAPVPEPPAARIVTLARPMPVAFRSRAALRGTPPPSDARSENH